MMKTSTGDLAVNKYGCYWLQRSHATNVHFAFRLKLCKYQIAYLSTVESHTIYCWDVSL